MFVFLLCCVFVLFEIETIKLRFIAIILYIVTPEIAEKLTRIEGRIGSLYDGLDIEKKWAVLEPVIFNSYRILFVVLTQLSPYSDLNIVVL